MTDIQDFVSRLPYDFKEKINDQVKLSITRLEALVNHIDKLPSESQIELCQFVRDNRKFLEYAQEFYSCSHKDLIGAIGRCIFSSESHLATLITLAKPDTSFEMKSTESTESDEKDRDVTVDKKSKGAK